MKLSVKTSAFIWISMDNHGQLWIITQKPVPKSQAYKNKNPAKDWLYQHLAGISGEGGIRTRGSRETRYVGLANRSHRFGTHRTITGYVVRG